MNNRQSTLREQARRWLVICGVWLGMLGLSACGQDQATQPVAPTIAPAPSASAIAATAAPATAPTAARLTPVPTPGPGEFANPVINQDFPDPDLLDVDTTYYAYATNSGTINVQVASSTDLVGWQILSDALPSLPPWAQPGFTWAPEVTTSADGTVYVMYFTARDKASERQCIGVATSSAPEGPFQSPGDKPLICQTEQGGSIDASSFTDEDGTRYLLWKNDGNCCGQDTWIYIQQVSADGLTLEGEPTRLIKQDQFWEGGLIEAPTLWKQNGTYYLFYSANNYSGANYAAGYAVANEPLGPYEKAADRILKTRTEGSLVIGPGGQDIVIAPDGETWIVYHAWNPLVTYRSMRIDPLDWEGSMPVVDGPSSVPQPIP